MERAKALEERLHKGREDTLYYLFDRSNTEYGSKVMAGRYEVERDIRDKAADFDMSALDSIYDDLAHLHDAYTIPEIPDNHRWIIDYMNQRNGSTHSKV